jgi:Uma2 family endonuclease
MRRLKIADLAMFPDDLPSGPARYELHDGVLVISGAPTSDHGRVQASAIAQLVVQGDQRRVGQTTGRVAVVLRTDPDHLFTADVTHRRREKCPPRLTEDGYLLTMPDLVVEIQDRDESGDEMQRRADDYLAAGVVCVWVIDPVGRQVIESRSGVAPRVIGENDTLTLDDVIPGFALAVRDVLG